MLVTPLAARALGDHPGLADVEGHGPHADPGLLEVGPPLPDQEPRWTRPGFAAAVGGLVSLAVERSRLVREALDAESDEARGRFAVRLLETKRPAFLTLHLLAVDHAQHETGPMSTETFAAIERLDAVVARLRDTAERLAPGSPVTGRVYFLSQGEPLPLWELVNRILAAARLPPVTRRVPAGLAYLAGWLCEVWYTLTGRQDEPPMTRFLARELATAHWFDLTAARRDLGYQPAVSLDEGLRRLEDWLRQIPGTTRASAGVP